MLRIHPLFSLRPAFNCAVLVPRHGMLSKRSPLLRMSSKSFHPPSGAVLEKCPSCSQPLATSLPACTNCWFIAGLPSSVSYHRLLSMPEGSNPFVVDAAALKRNFRQAQTVCHPDTWSSKGQDKQNVAHSLSSLVNDAYQRLLKPLSRAEYILERNHHPMTEDDKLDDMSLISEIMEAREAIENADDRVTVEAVQDSNRGIINDTLKEIETLVAERNWLAVKDATIRLKYLEGIDRAAREYFHAHP